MIRKYIMADKLI